MIVPFRLPPGGSFGWSKLRRIILLLLFHNRWQLHLQVYLAIEELDKVLFVKNFEDLVKFFFKNK